jgi:hypothetical protein
VASIKIILDYKKENGRHPSNCRRIGKKHFKVSFGVGKHASGAGLPILNCLPVKLSSIDIRITEQ